MGLGQYFRTVANAPDITDDPLGALPGLPRSSAAEFREAAWPLWYVQFRRVAVDRNLAAVPSVRSVAGWALSGLGLLGVFEVFDSSNTDALKLQFGLFGIALIVVGQLLLLWKRRDLKKIMALLDRNDALAALSAHIDHQVAAKQIPMAPQWWRGPTPPPLTGKGELKFGWKS